MANHQMEEERLQRVRERMKSTSESGWEDIAERTRADLRQELGLDSDPDSALQAAQELAQQSIDVPRVGKLGISLRTLDGKAVRVWCEPTATIADLAAEFSIRYVWATDASRAGSPARARRVHASFWDQPRTFVDHNHEKRLRREAILAAKRSMDSNRPATLARQGSRGFSRQRSDTGHEDDDAWQGIDLHQSDSPRRRDQTRAQLEQEDDNALADAEVDTSFARTLIWCPRRKSLSPGSANYSSPPPPSAAAATGDGRPRSASPFGQSVALRPVSTGARLSEMRQSSMPHRRLSSSPVGGRPASPASLSRSQSPTPTFGGTYTSTWTDAEMPDWVLLYNSEALDPSDMVEEVLSNNAVVTVVHSRAWRAMRRPPPRRSL